MHVQKVWDEQNGGHLHVCSMLSTSTFIAMLDAAMQIDDL